MRRPYGDAELVAGSAPEASRASGHRIPLGRTRWWVWRDARLLQRGFPASGLERLSAPDLAATADAHLAGAVGRPDFEMVFAEATTAQAAEVDRIVADRWAREAFAWEEPRLRHAFALLASTAGRPRDRRRAYLERTIARVWQRYCAVNASIGCWGPFAWFTLDPARPATLAAPGPALLDRRKVFLEPWALEAYAARLAADPALRRWMPAWPKPYQAMDGLTVRRPGRAPAVLAREEAAAIALCDGRRPGVLVAADLVAAGVVASGGVAAAIDLLEGLVARGLLEWGPNLPIGVRTEQVLDERIAAIGDPALRTLALRGLDRLRSARDAVAGAAGDPEGLATALDVLRATVGEVTGREVRRGRRSRHACIEEATLDVRFSLGHAVLDDLAPALDVVLLAARWFTADFAVRFEDALTVLVAAASDAGGQPTLSDVWDRGVDMLIGARDRGAYAAALGEFERRWRELLGWDGVARRLTTTASALRDRASRSFAAGGPGWGMARIHSPDILIGAESAQALDAGRYMAVLGEMHIALATFGDRSNAWALPDPERFMDLTVEDTGGPRLLPLIPGTWSRRAGRSLHWEEADADYQVGFARATGVVADRLVPACGVAIERAGDRWAGRLPGGALVPLVEFFGAFLSLCATNALREVMRGPHTPRVTIDRLVVWRESWRLTGEEIDALALPDDETEAYLAGRRLAVKRELPSQCYARLSSERKPIYVDFTSPLFVSLLCSSVRSGRRLRSDLKVTLTEMLPTTEQVWPRSARGDRHVGEIRFHITDPEPARGLDG